MATRKKCRFCNKKVKGLTEKHADYLLLQHIVAKHREKIEVKRR